MNNQINRKILITKITCKHNRLRRLVGPHDSSLKHAKHYFHWLQETDTHSSVMGSLLGGCSSSSEPMLTSSVCLSVSPPFLGFLPSLGLSRSTVLGRDNLIGPDNWHSVGVSLLSSLELQLVQSKQQNLFCSKHEAFINHEKKVAKRLLYLEGNCITGTLEAV